MAAKHPHQPAPYHPDGSSGAGLYSSASIGSARSVRTQPAKPAPIQTQPTQAQPTKYEIEPAAKPRSIGVRETTQISPSSAQPPSPPIAVSPAIEPVADLPLDASSLATVLDMLAVIDSIDELALLELLTPLQKRQVWDATAEAVRERVRQVRLGNPVPSPAVLPTDRPQRPTADLPKPPPSQPATVLPAIDRHPAMPLAVGHWVVLKAKPKLSPTELKAVWKITEMHGQHARIVAPKLGARLYPLTWMMQHPGQAAQAAE